MELCLNVNGGLQRIIQSLFVLFLAKEKIIFFEFLYDTPYLFYDLNKFSLYFVRLIKRENDFYQKKFNHKVRI